jgi:hypothetical protein
MPSIPACLRRDYTVFRSFGYSAKESLDYARATAWRRDVGAETSVEVDMEATDDEGYLRYIARVSLKGFSESLGAIDAPEGDSYYLVVFAELAIELRARILQNARNLTSYGPGKYRLAIDAVATYNEFSSESFGDSETFGFVEIFEGAYDPEDLPESEDLKDVDVAYLAAIYGAIAVTDSYGFTDVAYFDSREAFEEAKRAIAARYEALLEEEEEEDEGSCV